MADIENEMSTEILRAQTHIWNHMFSFINSMLLKYAIELEIPDIIHKHGRPMTLSKLIDALPINKIKSDNVHRIMRILTRSKFFCQQKIEDDQEEGYWLTPNSKLLLKDDPLSLAPFLSCMFDPIMIEPWHHLGNWFKNEDQTPFETAFGRTFYDYIGQDPKLSQRFNDGMASDTQLISYVVIRDFKGVFDGLSSLVDVAGGIGAFSKAIASVYPNMKCISFDQPHVVAGLEGTHNLSFVGGDMFLSIPPANAILMKWIMHDWSDEDCRRILKNCKEAIPSKEKGGKVIIFDIVFGHNEGDEELVQAHLFMDVEVMTLYNGKQRNEEEWAKLFLDVGFSEYKITHDLRLRSIIEVYP